MRVETPEGSVTLLPAKQGQVLMAIEDGIVVPCTPIVTTTFPAGWLVNDHGQLLVSTEIAE